MLENITEGPVIVQKRPKAEAEADALALLEQVGLAAKRISTRSSCPVGSSSGWASPGRWR